MRRRSFVALHATETVRPAIVSLRRLALEYAMFAHVKFESALVGLVCIAVGCMNSRASAVTVEIARKCAALTAKASPPKAPGNPAVGLAKGTAQFKRDYFNKCVANEGNMDYDAPEHPPLPPSGGAASVPQRDRTSELSQSLCPLIQSVAAQNELPVEFFARLILAGKPPETRCGGPCDPQREACARHRPVHACDGRRAFFAGCV